MKETEEMSSQETPIPEAELETVAGGNNAESLITEASTNETKDETAEEAAGEKGLFFKKKKFFGHGHGHGHGHF